MRRRRGMRRRLILFGVVLFILLGGLMILSCTAGPVYFLRFEGFDCELSGEALSVRWPRSDRPLMFTATSSGITPGRSRAYVAWLGSSYVWPTIFGVGQSRGFIKIPLVLPWALVALSTAILWRLERRPVPPGFCKTCGYNLTGNTTGRCPECGQPTANRAQSN